MVINWRYLLSLQLPMVGAFCFRKEIRDDFPLPELDKSDLGRPFQFGVRGGASMLRQ